MSFSTCCLKAFEWGGTPTGRTGKLGTNDTYIAGDENNTNGPAVLMIHDALGWTWSNARLLADHYAREIGATVYLPDFFGGEQLPRGIVLAGEFHKLDMPAFLQRNARAVREPEIFGCARELRARGHARVGAVGFCYGGWAVFRLGARAHAEEGGEEGGGGQPVVDAVVAGHPTLLTKEDIDGVGVPTQVLAPEIDPVYTDELKRHTFDTMLRLGSVPFDYQHFPGQMHGCLTRGDEDTPGEREAMAAAKIAAVGWLRRFLVNA